MERKKKAGEVRTPQPAQAYDLAKEPSTPARVKWTSGALLAAKRDEQAKVNELGRLDCDFSPKEHVRLLLALGRLRAITKERARHRAALTDKKEH